MGGLLLSSKPMLFNYFCRQFLTFFFLCSPGHNRSMAEEYTTATETESVISSRHSGKILVSFFSVYLLSCGISLLLSSAILYVLLCFAMKRGTYCPALAVCIVRLMKNMIALMVSLVLHVFLCCFVVALWVHLCYFDNQLKLSFFCSSSS